ncbi:outer membrane lipoprotein LolB [Noviherbaspirillum humi]|uniref:Outer-membrane lipoprotein LolB n=1 Tax=Noviherbaspirillum humi TaxID=1688639 RepID=A0A239CLP0_9BURK|nr:outer membrane lipoprotein LolB [Noviherbaspirillum humi]SNS20601.1 outer membrane lipoprotein LolB [Noviherbaspirillum humi]
MMPFRGSCRAARGGLALLLSFSLAGCAGLLPSQAAPDSEAAIQAAGRPYLDTLKVNGRLSVRYQANGKDESLSGGFLWSQAPRQTQVTLLSPLGQTVALIEASPDGATFQQSGQPPRSAGDVDSLVAQTLGWPLPVSGLRDWLQGFATDQQGRRFIATPARQEVTTADGWRLLYASWSDASDGQPPRPRRIDAQRATVEAGEVALRIVIDGWQ